MQKLVLITIFMSCVIGNIEEFSLDKNLEFMQDMSETCVNDLHLDMFLPYGMGIADTLVVLISSKDKQPNCMISFNILETKDDLFVIIVVELSDSSETHANACHNVQTRIIIIKEKEKIDVCTHMENKESTNKAIYYHTSKSSKLSVQIKSQTVLPTIKLTATAARIPPPNVNCKEETEITCLMGNMTLCISIELLCDRNINCGIFGSNDEDVRICELKRYYKLWAVVSCSLLMMVIIAGFLINLFKMYVPSVPDNFFIFNEDEDNKLILATKYIAPQRSPSHQKIHDAEIQSLKLRSYPLPGTSQEEQEPHTSSSLEKSVGTDETIDIELLKAELRKEIEKEISRAIMQQYRPRFDSDTFISIMDHIDPPDKSKQGES